MGNTTTESDMSAESFSFLSSASAMTSLSAHSSPASRLADKGPARQNSQSLPESTSTVTRTHIMEPYTTLGQLSYAPATQTTIVTTTTTTTTTFPPLVMNPPRNLSELDPKLYPLASAPTPQSLRNFCFDFGGRPACFREADNAEKTLQECHQKYSSLQSSNGLLRSVQEDGPHYQTPSRFLRHKGSSFEDLHTPSIPSSTRMKRSASPSGMIPSIAEAAEIVSLQRKHRKLRASLNSSRDREKGKATSTRLRNAQSDEHPDGTIPATPDTDAGSTGQFKMPRARPRSRRSQLRASIIDQRKASHNVESSRQSIRELSEQESYRKADPAAGVLASSSRDGASVTGFANGLRLLGAPSVIDGPGVSATPPIAESDLEPILVLETEDNSFSRPARPAPLDTISTQNASLPSPSLSPTTAAATLAHHGSASTTTLDDDDDSNDVSSLDISQDNVDDDYARKLKTDMLLSGKASSFPGSETNAQFTTPTFMEIPTMLDSFDALPDEFKTYVMYQLLRRCAKPTLHFVADVVNPALKCDFIGLLPLELSLNIVKYLDFQSMCRAAQVSKKWRQVINSDEKAWKELLDKDGYTLPEGELQRAIREGWGWQYPHSTESWERDISEVMTKSDVETSPASSASSVSYRDGEVMLSASGRPKRKAASKYSSNKKQRRKAPSSSKTQSVAWMRELEVAQGPRAYAQAASSAIPYANVGLPSLRSLHLFKSLYARHHLIRKSWMVDDTRPQHITFRAHGRHVVTCLQFDTDKILTGSDDTNINVYDTKTGALRARLEGHEGGVWALQYEGNTLVSGSTDRSVRVWDIEKAKCTQIFQGHTSTVRCLVILKPTKTGENADGTPIMVPKEPLIITGSRDSSLRVWKLPGPNDRGIFQTGPPVNDYDNPYFIRALTGHHHSVRAIAAHADTLVSGSYDCIVRVWKISTGEVLHRLQGHSQKVYSVVLDHTRNRCISGSMDNLVKVWSLETGACLFNLEGHTSLVGLLDLSHDRLVSAAADSTLRIWDPENGQCKARLSAHTGAITCFQHDDQKVISGSDRTLKMWNIKTGECVKDLLTDLSGVWQVKFNERRCVAAVQRNSMTYIEVLDFGAARDGVPTDQRGRRIVVDSKGREIEEITTEEREVLDTDAVQG